MFIMPPFHDLGASEHTGRAPHALHTAGTLKLRDFNVYNATLV
jgi:hypothetical protein